MEPPAVSILPACCFFCHFSGFWRRAEYIGGKSLWWIAARNTAHPATDLRHNKGLVAAFNGISAKVEEPSTEYYLDDECTNGASVVLVRFSARVCGLRVVLPNKQ